MKPRRSLTLRLARVFTLGWSESPLGKSWLRGAVHKLVLVVLRARGRPLGPADLARVVVVAPHPDDETFGCGGTVARLSRAGTVLSLVVLTDGSASHPAHTALGPADVAALRRGECARASEALGVSWSTALFLDAPDGDLPRIDPDRRALIVRRLAHALEGAAPVALLVPLRRDGSSEHEAAFGIVQGALHLSGRGTRVLEYPVWSWWNPLRLLAPALTARKVWRVDTSAVRDAKSRAIACYASQVSPLPPDTEAALPRGFSARFLGPEEFLLES